jgi:hypothetical protein
VKIEEKWRQKLRKTLDITMPTHIIRCSDFIPSKEVRKIYFGISHIGFWEHEAIARGDLIAFQRLSHFLPINSNIARMVFGQN